MVKGSSRVQDVSEPGEDVYFKHHKVDVAPGDARCRNQALLDGFLGDRRLSYSGGRYMDTDRVLKNVWREKGLIGAGRQ